MNSLILGLSSGVTCLSFCAPVILPFYLNKGDRVKNNYLDLILFMAGRLLGYLAFGVGAFFTGKLLLENNPNRNCMEGAAYIVISIILLFEFMKEGTCIIKKIEPIKKRLKNMGILFPLLLGLATGVNLCPTFALVFTQASGMESLLGSIWFFFLFFIGTTVYFIPLPLLGLLRKKEGARVVGRFMVVFISVWFIIKGFFMIINSGGIQ